MVDVVVIEVSGIPLALIVSAGLIPALWTFFFFYYRYERRVLIREFRKILRDIKVGNADIEDHV